MRQMTTQNASKNSYNKQLGSTKTGIPNSIPILVIDGSSKVNHSIAFVFNHSIEEGLRADSSDFTSYCCVFDVTLGGSMVESDSNLMRADN